MESNTTCNWFDDFVSLVVAAVAGLEGDLVGSTVWGFEPRLQESGQVLQHVILEGLACSSHLDERKTRIRHCGQEHETYTILPLIDCFYLLIYFNHSDCLKLHFDHFRRHKWRNNQWCSVKTNLDTLRVVCKTTVSFVMRTQADLTLVVWKLWLMWF